MTFTITDIFLLGFGIFIGIIWGALIFVKRKRKVVLKHINIGYDNISTNLLKSFDGSIGKAAKLQENKALYDEIEKVISNFDKKDLIDIILDAKIIYDKDNILDILDHITVCLFANAERNEKYVDCIKYVNDCAKKIRTYSNFDMSVDIMIFSIWEELNENSNRC